MKDLLDRYVRSLLEQEQARTAPEYRQDLGTFVDWLVERHGYAVHLRTFRHEGTERRASRGVIQWGRDILATKMEPAGLRGYRFVLKQGDISQRNWSEFEDGMMANDLRLAAGLPPGVDQMHLSGLDVTHWTVVAVHNGDFDTDKVGPQRDQLIRKLRQRWDVEVEWWDASRLVELALASPASAKQSLIARADPSLLPPGARPFARLALDSLSRAPGGSEFDLDAVDRLLDGVLPVHAALEAARYYRALTELGLFAGMVDVECRAREEVRGSTLPALDTYERVLCRALHAGAAVDRDGGERLLPRTVDFVKLLLRQYIGIAERLLERISSVLPLEAGLALASPSERIDYPIRALRLAGYFATAAAASLDLGNTDSARRFADALLQLFENNPGGALTPVVDDQVIELGLVWDAWRRSGRDNDAARTAQELVWRFLWRRQFGLPLPALWAQARVPLDERTARVLVDAQFQFPAPGFEDGGSLILPLALYIGFRDAPESDGDQMLRAFGTGEQENKEDRAHPRARLIHPQAWLPPNDAHDRWYGESLARTGSSHVFRVGIPFRSFAKEFEQVNTQSSASSSRAAQWGLSSIDRIAWKVLRNPPPMSIFIRAPEPTSNST